jgi:hypothetical protein
MDSFLTSDRNVCSILYALYGALLKARTDPSQPSTADGDYIELNSDTLVTSHEDCILVDNAPSAKATSQGT